jgi:hypothetical protein
MLLLSILIIKTGKCGELINIYILYRMKYTKSKRSSKRSRNTKKNIKKRKQRGGGGPIKFGMLFSIPRNSAEAAHQIPKNIDSILKFKPNIIGLVSPSDAPGTTTRTEMWDQFATELAKRDLTRLVMQHFPYTTVGGVGKTAGTQLKMENIMTRVDAIRAKGINNILGLKGWEQNINYLEKNAVEAPQPEYLFANVPAWISFLKTQFENVAGTTYIEGHPFRRRRLEANNKPNNFHAIKKEYNFTGKPYLAGILKNNLIAGIEYDVKKIIAGATKIFCAHVFEAALFVKYRDLFEKVAAAKGVNNAAYELIPEISVGASKQSFYNDTLLSSTYCPEEFQDEVFRSGVEQFVEGAKVKVIGRGAELSEKEKANRKYYHNATIVAVKNDCPGLECYDIKYDDEAGHIVSEIEENVPISRISTAEADKLIRDIWIKRLKEQIAIFKDNNVTSLYVVSIDMDATLQLVQESLDAGLLRSSPELYP